MQCFHSLHHFHDLRGLMQNNDRSLREVMMSLLFCYCCFFTHQLRPFRYVPKASPNLRLPADLPGSVLRSGCSLLHLPREVRLVRVPHLHPHHRQVLREVRPKRTSPLTVSPWSPSWCPLIRLGCVKWCLAALTTDKTISISRFCTDWWIPDVFFQYTKQHAWKPSICMKTRRTMD